MKERKVRVFISSTFTDMNDERDYLNDLVFPRIHAYCEERFIEFIPIDLRWGIPEEASRSGLVLAACMEEVDNSRPFFVGIIGDRYGWIPRIEDVNCSRPVITRNQDWLLQKITDSSSITEMEIEYATMQANAVAHGTFFLKEGVEQLPPEYREETGSLRARKLDALRAKLRKQDRYPVYSYRTPKEMGDILLEELKAMIDQEFPPIENAYSNAIIARHEMSLLRRSETLYSYGERLEKFFSRWEGENYKTTRIEGTYGSGASNYLANLTLYMRKHTSSKVLYYDFDMADQGENLIDDFFRFLRLPENQVASDKWSMIAIDNASQLSKEETLQLIEWLDTKNSNLHAVITSIAAGGDEIIGCMPYSLEQPPFELSIEQKRDVVLNYVKKYGKELTEAQVETIVHSPQSGNITVLLLLLNTLVNYGSLDGLQQRINQLTADGNELIFNTLLNELEKLLEPENLADWFKELIFIISLHGSLGISERYLLAFSKVPMEKWAVLRPIIIQFCHNGSRLSLLSIEWRLRLRKRYDPAWIALLVRRLVNWWADKKGHPCAATSMIMAFALDHDKPFPRDKETEKMFDNLVYAIASPKNTASLRSSAISCWWGDIFRTMPFSKSITPAIQKELAEAPLATYQAYFKQLITIAESLSRRSDASWCYEQLAKRAQSKHEKNLYMAQSYLAQGHARKAIRSVTGLFGIITGSTIEQLEKRFIRAECFLEQGLGNKCYYELNDVAKLLSALQQVPSIDEKCMNRYIDQAHYYYTRMLAGFAFKGDAEGILLASDHAVKKLKKNHITHIPSLYYNSLAHTLVYLRGRQWDKMLVSTYLLLKAAHAEYGGGSYQNGRARLLHNCAYYKLHGSWDPNPSMFANNYKDSPFEEQIPTGDVDPEIIERIKDDNKRFAEIAQSITQ